MRFCLVNIQWKANGEELKTMRGKIDYYIHGLLTYCPYQECNAYDKRAELKEFKWGFTLFERSKLSKKLYAELNHLSKSYFSTRYQPCSRQLKM